MTATLRQLPAETPEMPRLENIAAEQDLLGAILTNNAAYAKVADFIRPEHFASPVHARIFEAAALLIARGARADPVTLKGYFEREAELETVGGTAYLAKLMSAATTVINAADYGRSVVEMWQRRRARAAAQDFAEAVSDPDIEAGAADLIESHMSDLLGIVEGAADRRGRALPGVLDELMTEIEDAQAGRVVALSTGVRALDRQLAGGLRRSHLVVLAGRPGMGKTAQAVAITRAALRSTVATDKADRARVAFFSLEMRRTEIVKRLLALEADVDSEQMDRADGLGEADWGHIEAARARMADWGELVVDDAGGLNVEQISARAHALSQSAGGLDLVIVDHLQLMSTSASTSRLNRVDQVGHASKLMKALAKRLDVPVILLSQLNRQVENRDDKRPKLSDLRDSGAIEQDADEVLMLYRAEYYLEKQKPEPSDHGRMADWMREMDAGRNVMEIIVEKNRHGRVGTVRAACDMSRSWVGDLETGEY